MGRVERTNKTLIMSTQTHTQIHSGLAHTQTATSIPSIAGKIQQLFLTKCWIRKNNLHANLNLPDSLGQLKSHKN